MQTKVYYVVFVVFMINVNLYSIHGYPTKGIKDKSINLSNLGDKWKTGHDSFLSVLFNKTSTSSSENKRPYDIEELIANCKNENGEQRISCVASYIRNLLPDIFSRSKDVGKLTKSKVHNITRTFKPVSTTRHMSLSISETTSTPLSASPSHTISLSETTRAGIPKTIRKSSQESTSTKMTTRAGKADGTTLSSAVLIVPGDPKIITSIIQDTESNILLAVKDNAKIKPITCRRDEFGFTADVDPTIMDIANDMLCSLCKYQRDSAKNGFISGFELPWLCRTHHVGTNEYGFSNCKYVTHELLKIN